MRCWCFSQQARVELLKVVMDGRRGGRWQGGARTDGNTLELGIGFGARDIRLYRGWHIDVGVDAQRRPEAALRTGRRIAGPGPNTRSSQR